MTAAHVDARKRRLERLVLGLYREVATVRGGDGPLLSPERRAYLDALRAAVAGLETARVTLSRALGRLESSA
jgi:hypothetical protein